MTSFQLLTVLLVAASVAPAEKSKELERRVTVTAGQAVEIRGLNGSEIEIKTWDKSEVYVRLHVVLSSSNKELEKEYIDGVAITDRVTADRAVITFSEPKHDLSDGFSFKKLFTLSFGSYIRKEISGEVFVPKKNAFTSDMKYGSITLDDMAGSVRLEGQSNTIRIRKCSNLSWIRNDYGTGTIDDSGGELDLKTQSGKVEIENFTGSLVLSADYSTVTVGKVSKGLRLTSKSATIKVADIGGDASIDADYSTVTVERVKGTVKVSDKSGNIKVHSVEGASIDGAYSNIQLSSVAGTAEKTITITGMSGKLNLSDVVGNVQIDNPYSTMELMNVKGNVNLKTKSGSVTAEEVSGDWTSDTEYSTIRLRKLRAQKVLMENSSGVVEVDLLNAPKHLEVRNQYADVNIHLPQGLASAIRIKSEYGTVKTNLPVEIETFSTGALAIGSTGDGSGSFRVETKSGNVKVQQK